MLLHNFRWVCTRWRSAIHGSRSMFIIYRAMGFVAKPSICANEDHKVPLLMLPEPENEDSVHRRFYSIAKRKVVRQVELPPLASTGYPWLNTRYLSSYGWLLSISDGGTELLLINPLTGATIKMPTITDKDGDLKQFHGGVYAIRRFTLSANPSITCDFVAAVVFLTSVSQAEYDVAVASWRNGDDNWIQLVETDRFYACVSLTFYLGEFCGLSSDGKLMKYGSGRALQKAVAVVGRTPIHYSEYHDGRNHFKNYLVESEGRLLVVRQVIRCESGATKLFRIYEVNVEKGETQQVLDLDNRSIFIGSNSSAFSVKPSYTNGCKPNCVYYTQFELAIDDYYSWYAKIKPKPLDLGVYNVIDGKIEHYIYGPHRRRVRKSKLNPHMWVDC